MELGLILVFVVFLGASALSDDSPVSLTRPESEGGQDIIHPNLNFDEDMENPRATDEAPSTLDRLKRSCPPPSAYSINSPCSVNSPYAIDSPYAVDSPYAEYSPYANNSAYAKYSPYATFSPYAVNSSYAYYSPYATNSPNATNTPYATNQQQT